MEIKDFIKVVISDISSAVAESSVEIKATGAVLNPLIDINGFMEGGTGGISAPKRRKVQEIELSIALTISETDNDSKKVGINVAGFNAEISGGDGEKLMSTSSRVKFNIPIAFPVGN